MTAAGRIGPYQVLSPLARGGQGTVLVARALGVRSDLACLVAGFAFALSPRMISTIGPISSEAWPSAMAPWVLLPLVIGAERGSPRRMAMLAGLAVAMVGGVNAAATFAVIVQNSVFLNASISRSRSTTMRSATDCTRPADSFPPIVLHNSGETL